MSDMKKLMETLDKINEDEDMSMTAEQIFQYAREVKKFGSNYLYSGDPERDRVMNSAIMMAELYIEAFNKMMNNK